MAIKKFMAEISDISARSVIINAENRVQAVETVQALRNDGTIPDLTSDDYRGEGIKITGELTGKMYEECLSPNGRPMFGEYFAPGCEPEEENPDEDEETKETPIHYGRRAENLIEISLKYAEMVAADPSILDLDIEFSSDDWKEQFVEWANEFEELHPNPSEWEKEGRFYLEEIETFAEAKINEAVYALTLHDKEPAELTEPAEEPEPLAVKAKRIDADMLRTLCIACGWYTSGSAKDYHELLETADSCKCLTESVLECLATDIIRHTSKLHQEDLPNVKSVILNHSRPVLEQEES